jgi:hypothetical protein
VVSGVGLMSCGLHVLCCVVVRLACCTRACSLNVYCSAAVRAACGSRTVLAAVPGCWLQGLV